MNKSKKIQGESNEELAIKVYIHEHGKLRDELMYYLNTKIQLPIWAFGAASIAIPLLLSQSSTIPLNIMASILYSIAILFSGITMGYTSIVYGLRRVALYIANFIEPQVSQIIKANGYTGFQWETLIKQRRASLLELFLEIAGELGTVFLLILPGFASLMIARYIRSLPQSPIESVVVFEINLHWLNTLSIFAWSIYALSITSLVLIAIYSIKTGVANETGDINKK